MFRNRDRLPILSVARRIEYCDQTIIAILLVIIIAVTLFFDVRVHSVFDLSKITVLYLLVSAMSVVWSFKTIFIYGKDNMRVYRLTQPLNLPIVAFLFVNGLATFFSINPIVSLVGAYKRYGGFTSTLVYIILFYAVVNFIERKRGNSFLQNHRVRTIVAYQ